MRLRGGPTEIDPMRCRRCRVRGLSAAGLAIATRLRVGGRERGQARDLVAGTISN